MQLWKLLVWFNLVFQFSFEFKELGNILGHFVGDSGKNVHGGGLNEMRGFLGNLFNVSAASRRRNYDWAVVLPNKRLVLSQSKIDSCTCPLECTHRFL
jgi:hypothetical protein